MRPPVPLHGINGRLRKHIHKIGAAYATGIWPPREKKLVTNDEFLRELLDSGQITFEDLQKVISDCQKSPKELSWFDEFSDQILDKADTVFWAIYGRNPTEYEWPTKYRNICKDLKGDWHRYDDVIELQLREHYANQAATKTTPIRKPRMLEKVQHTERKIWDTGGIVGGLFFMGVGALFIYAGIKETSALWIGVPTTLIAAIVFLASLPRSFREEKKVYKCSECGHELDALEHSCRSCSNCGTHF